MRKKLRCHTEAFEAVMPFIAADVDVVLKILIQSF